VKVPQSRNPIKGLELFVFYCHQAMDSVVHSKRKSNNESSLRQKHRKTSSVAKSKDTSKMTSVSTESLNYIRNICRKRVKDVDANSLRSAKDQYLALVEKGFEDFAIVLTESGATAKTIGALCRKYPSEVKGLKFDVSAKGELLITKFAAGPEHQSAVLTITTQIGNFVANGDYNDIATSSDELSLTVHSPDVVICPFRFEENNLRHPRVSIEVEVDNRSGKGIRREGLRQFNDIPMLRMFIGVKFWKPSRSILVVQYAKNSEDNIVLLRTLSIGVEDVSCQALQKWTSVDAECLPPVVSDNVERFPYPYVREPVLEIPGIFIWYRIPTAESNVFSPIPDNAILYLHLTHFARALLRDPSERHAAGGQDP
jgi:hypothetical protein